jgi:hypothetical protein
MKSKKLVFDGEVSSRLPSELQMVRGKVRSYHWRFFAAYLDDLIKELRNTGLGCHIAGGWYGAAAFADDLVLMCPTRTAMQEML